MTKSDYDAAPRSLETYRQKREIEREDLTLIDAWLVLWEWRWLIAIIAGTVTIVAVIVALFLTPIYKAETLLAPNPNTMGATASLGGRLAAFADNAAMGGLGAPVGVTPTNVAIAVLQSRAFAERFIRDEKLMPILFPDGPTEGEGAPTMWDAFKIFSSILTVTTDKDTGLVTVDVFWKDPQLAARWANKLVAMVNEETRQRKVEDSETNLKYLTSQLEKESRSEVRATLTTLIEQEFNNVMLANSQEEYSFKIIDPAVVPQIKDSPKRAYIVLGAMILGIILGMITAFILNFRRKLKALS